MRYADSIKAHLSKYKIERLGVFENGPWKRNNKLYSHILPVNQQNLNFLERYREELSKYIQQKKIHLHSDFHHLNSSQAVCLNFFYPLIKEDHIHLLLQILQFENEVPVCCEFEKVISYAERTNFDFYIKLRSGKQVFFEIKYTENKFGKARSNAKYRNKFEKIYKHLFLGKLRPSENQFEELIKNNQLLRNITYVDTSDNDLLIIICPEANFNLHKEYEYVINNVVEPSIHKNIRLITWEKILDDVDKMLLALDNVPPNLLEHYNEFREKYLIRELK